MSMLLTLSDTQFRSLMRDEEFLKNLAREQAALIHEEMCKELGEAIGSNFPVPISLASRVSGWNERWIRRNLPLIEAEGQHDSISWGDLKKAMENRKNKGK